MNVHQSAWNTYEDSRRQEDSVGQRHWCCPAYRLPPSLRPLIQPFILGVTACFVQPFARQVGAKVGSAPSSRGRACSVGSAGPAARRCCCRLCPAAHHRRVLRAAMPAPCQVWAADHLQEPAHANQAPGQCLLTAAGCVCDWAKDAIICLTGWMTAHAHGQAEGACALLVLVLVQQCCMMARCCVAHAGRCDTLWTPLSDSFGRAVVQRCTR